MLERVVVESRQDDVLAICILAIIRDHEIINRLIHKQGLIDAEPFFVIVFFSVWFEAV